MGDEDEISDAEAALADGDTRQVEEEFKDAVSQYKNALAIQTVL